MSLNEYRDDVESRRVADNERELRRYHDEMQQTITGLRHALSELARLSPVVTPIAQRALVEYPPYEGDAPSVRKAVARLRSRCESTLHLLAHKPGEISVLLRTIENRDVSDFVHVALSTRLDKDKEEASPYLGAHHGLERFSEDLAELQHSVETEVEYWAAREAIGSGHRLEPTAAVHKEEKAEMPVIYPPASFDPRQPRRVRE